MGTVKKGKNGHGDTSRTPPYPQKRATLTHPPYSHFSKRKRRLEICYFKTAVRLLYFVLAHEYPAAETTVFLFRCGWLLFHRSLPILELEVIKRFRSFTFTTVSNSFMTSLAIQI